MSTDFKIPIDGGNKTRTEMTVFKFGGTSVGSIERIQHVAALCELHKPSAVVVSAMSGETNRLISLAKQISPRTDLPEYDMLVASGEQVSVSLLCLALRQRGLVPFPMLANTAGIITDSQFSRASILEVKGSIILDAIQRGMLPVIAGFQGVTKDGQLTSLGRGGSDTSAVAVAAGIGAQECVIYTDVDGVFTTDPRICKDARIIRCINYEEMLEMASQGSKVLHIRSVQLAAKWGIRLVVKNTFSDDEGTEMRMDTTKDLEGELVSGVSGTKDEAWLQVGPTLEPEFNLAQVFTVLAEKGINVDIITQNIEETGVKINFTVTESDALLAESILRKKFPQIPILSNCGVAKVSIVGVGMRTHPGVAARMFRTLATYHIKVLLVATSEIKVACLIPRESYHTAVQMLHQEFI